MCRKPLEIEQTTTKVLNNKQLLLNEVEHDIESYQGRGLCYQFVITQTDEALVILDIMRKPNAIIVLLCIQKEKKQRNG